MTIELQSPRDLVAQPYADEALRQYFTQNPQGCVREYGLSKELLE